MFRIRLYSKSCARFGIFVLLLLIFNASFSPATEIIEENSRDGDLVQQAGDRPDQTRMEPPTVRSKAGEAAVVKRKTLLYILGGAVVVGGIAAYLFLSGGDTTGSIQVVSTPPGATVYLDGADTGLLTDCTITEVDEGSHTIRVFKDGFFEDERTVSVSKKETTNVNVALSAHTLTITEPKASSLWTAGDSMTISWSTSGNAGFQARPMTDYGIAPLTGMTASAARINRLRMHRFASNRSQRAAGRSAGRTLRSTGPAGGTSAGADSMASEIPSIRRDDLRMQHFPQAPGGFQIQGDAEILTLNEVAIDLLRAGNVVHTIAAGISNSGSYSWRVPPSLANGVNYKVRVSCSTDSIVTVESAPFTISELGTLRVESQPAGALITLDGVHRGVSGKTIGRLPVGSHVLKLTRDRCQVWSETVIVAKNQTTEVEAVLAAGSFSENFNENTSDYWIKGDGDGRWYAQESVYACLGKTDRSLTQISHYNLGKVDNRWTFGARGQVGLACEPFLAYGVIFGIPDDLGSGYYFVVRESEWAVFKGRSPFDESSVSPLQAWTRSHDIKIGGWNALKVEADGKKFRFFINGAFQGTLTIDDIPAQGRLGLITETDTDRDEIYFDDVYLTLKSR